MKRILLGVILSGVCALYGLSADTSCLCEAPAGIQAEIRLANQSTIENLLAKYPDDFWVQRRYIEFKSSASFLRSQGLGMPSGKVDNSVIARFRKIYEDQPDSIQAAYIYAYALIHSNTAESVRILTEITQKSPSCASAWMTLGVLHGYGDFRDQKKQQACIEEYLRRCPDSIEPRVAMFAMNMDKSDVLVAYIKNLRTRIAGKEDEELLPLYYYLWRLELKSASQADTKNRIRRDLKFLEGLDRNRFRTAQSLLVQGYRLIGDTAGLDEAMKRNPQLASSNSSLLFSQANSEWNRSNPAPAPTASREESWAYYRKQLQFLNEWQSRMPDSMTLLEPRFNALASLPDTTREDLIHEGDRILLLASRTGGSAYIQPAIKVLQAWAERDVLTERIPGIIEEMKSSQTRTSLNTLSRGESDILNSATDLSLIEENRQWETDTGAWSVLVTVYSRNNQLEQAKKILTDWETALEARRKKIDELKAAQIERLRNRTSAGSATPQNSLVSYLESSMIRGFPGDESKYFGACAALAVAEERPIDALAYYQAVLHSMNASPASQGTLADSIRVKTAAQALWQKLGGTPKGWEVWNGSIQRVTAVPVPSTPRPAMTAKSIPVFSLADQYGKTWTLDSFKGKTTLINVWATWCGPCRNEMPHLQKLYERIKNRSDIQIVTLNVDEDQSLVPPFLKENKYSMPSLSARSFVKDFAGPIGIPTTWIVDASGIIRSESLGFRGDGDQYIEQNLKQLESVSKGSK